MDRKEVLLKLVKLHNKLNQLTATTNNNSHPYRQFQYFWTLNGDNCNQLNSISNIFTIKEFEPYLKDLVDTYGQFASQHPREFQ